MEYLNSMKARQDLSKIHHPQDQVKYQRIIAWATHITKRQEFLVKLKKENYHHKEYSDAVVAYDKQQPARLW